MTETIRKEKFGKAYIDAVAACAGVITSQPNADYGFDGRWNNVDYDEEHKRYSEGGFAIDYQLKSSWNIELEGNYIVYDLEVKNYRDLIKTNVGSSRILVLYIMPRDSECLNVSDSQSIFYKGAWWMSLRGLPSTNNETTVRIHIPIKQQLTPENINEMFSKIKKGEIL